MAETLELSFEEFKTIVISMIKVLIYETDHMQKQMSNVSRDGNPKIEPRRHARDQTVQQK